MCGPRQGVRREMACRPCAGEVLLAHGPEIPAPVTKLTTSPEAVGIPNLVRLRGNELELASGHEE